MATAKPVAPGLDDLLCFTCDNKMNLDVIVEKDKNTGAYYIGVRIRFWGVESRKNKMVLASGDNLYEAIYNALLAFKNGKLETLDWRARPWRAWESSNEEIQFPF